MTKLIITIILTLASTVAKAQLNGSGITITKSYDYKNFDKLLLQDLDGEIEVNVSNEFKITVTIDDNLFSLFFLEENQVTNELKIGFKNNLKNKKYIENTNLKIQISIPKIDYIYQSGNSNLFISNLSGSQFTLKNAGNGMVKILGAIDNLTITNTGNGNTIAQGLTATNALINSLGNGSVSVKVSNKIIAKASGNSSVNNYGKAKFDFQSSKTGNAELRNKL